MHKRDVVVVAVDVACHASLDGAHRFPRDHEGADAAETRYHQADRPRKLVAPRGCNQTRKVESVRSSSEAGEPVHRREIRGEEIDLKIWWEALQHLVERPERSPRRQPVEEGHP